MRTISTKFLLIITTPYKTEFKKWEIAGIEPSLFGSEGYAVLHVRGQ